MNAEAEKISLSQLPTADDELILTRLSPKTRAQVIAAATARNMSIRNFVEQALLDASAYHINFNSGALSTQLKGVRVSAEAALAKMRAGVSTSAAQGKPLGALLVELVEQLFRFMRDSLMQPGVARPQSLPLVSAPARKAQALARIDAANENDPAHIRADNETLPKELHYGREMSKWLMRLYPDASEALQLAARGQHIRRFTRPRETYAEGRAGYLAWRNDLKKFHAEETARILTDLGYDRVTIERVRTLIRKDGLKRDEEVQRLEDVACVVFLMNELPDFAVKHPRDKIDDILAKTWAKMSPGGREAALKLELPPISRDLITALLSHAQAS